MLAGSPLQTSTPRFRAEEAADPLTFPILPQKIAAPSLDIAADPEAAIAGRIGDISPYILSWRKRLLDIAVALVALLVFLPLMLQLAFLVRATSPGPILFSQRRNGRGDRIFAILKFRTMFHDGRREGEEFLAQASRGDARVTPVGRWMRRLSFDELPQLLNVLKGEMSVVGPRPHALCHDRYYAAHVRNYMRRYRCRPGMTGLAQIRGARGETRAHEDMQRRIDLDLHYIATASFSGDLMILVATALAMFRQDVY